MKACLYICGGSINIIASVGNTMKSEGFDEDWRVATVSLVDVPHS